MRLLLGLQNAKHGFLIWIQNIIKIIWFVVIAATTLAIRRMRTISKKEMIEIEKLYVTESDKIKFRKMVKEVEEKNSSNK